MKILGVNILPDDPSRTLMSSELMKIKGLTIQNFKAISNHRFELASLNVFLGKNSMGKSSTIQSLLLLKANFERHQIIDTILYDPVKVQGSFELKTRFLDLGFSNEVFKVDESEEQIIFNVEIGNEGFVKVVCEFESGKDFLVFEANSQKIEKFPDFFGPHFQYLNANRISPNDLFALSLSEVERKFQLGNSGEHTPHFLLRFGNDKLFYVEQSLLHPSTNVPDLLNQVSAYMSDLGSELRVQVSQIADRVQLKYDVFRSNGLTDTFKPQNVGFGLTYSMPVVTSLLAGKPGKVQIIENPESHLHPKGQAQMGRLLAKAANAGQQLFIETHSDHIINGIRVAVKEGLLNPEDVIFHFFDKPKGQKDVVISPIRIDKDGNLSDYPDGFLDEWDNQLLKLI